jgi:GT2 family glycosyltransferase
VSTPRVSVVVPTRDRVDRLHNLLRSLAAQSLPAGEFEILVVDDGSTEPVTEPEEWSQGNRPALRILRREESGGPGAARNIGWRAAQGPLIAFTDDDCRPDPDWLRAVLACWGEENEVFVQGRTLPDPDDGPVEPLSRTIILEGPNELYVTCNAAYSQALLERIGGFDERYLKSGEDVDLGWRAKKAGGRPVFGEEAVVYHAVTKPDLRATLRWTTRWTDAPRVLRAHPELRGILVAGIFWKDSHPPLLALLAGAAAAQGRRSPALLVVAALPYFLHYRRRYAPGRRPWRTLARLLPRHLVVDLCEVGTVLVGSLRHRKLML